MASGRLKLGGVVAFWLTIACDDPHYCKGALTCDAGEAAAHTSDADVNPTQSYASGGEDSETTTDEQIAPAVSGDVCGSMTLDMGDSNPTATSSNPDGSPSLSTDVGPVSELDSGISSSEMGDSSVPDTSTTVIADASLDASADDEMQAGDAARAGRDADASPINPPCSTPFGEGECASDRWCKPSEAWTSGECVEYGTRGLNDACQADSDCSPALLCDGFTCQQSCDTEATGGPGVCPNGSTCYSSPDQSRTGQCRQVCEHGTVGCADDREVCVLGELINSPEDLCVLNGAEEDGVVGQQCTYPQGWLCGWRHVCLDTADGDVQCVEICRASEGTLGAPTHPDCTDARYPACMLPGDSHATSSLCMSLAQYQMAGGR